MDCVRAVSVWENPAGGGGAEQGPVEKQRKRIAFLGHVRHADIFGIGGMASYVRRLGTELARLGYTVDVYYHGAEARRTETTGAGVRIEYFRVLWEALAALALGNYHDIVRIWLSGWDRLVYVSYRLSPKRHQPNYHYMWFAVPDRRWKRVVAMIEQFLAVRAGRLVCVSPRQVHALQARILDAVLILPPVPEGFFARLEEKSLIWPVRVSFLGILHPDKGVRQTVELFRSLACDGRFQCTIYAIHKQCDPEQVALHKWLVSQVDIRYVPLGGVLWSPENEQIVQNVLRDTDIFVQPYRSLQNTVDAPLLVLEAMASCCAVLTTRIGSIPEVYGESPFVIDSPNFARRAEDLLKGLSLEDLAAERVRVHQRTEQLRFSARDVALRFVQEVLEAD